MKPGYIYLIHSVGTNRFKIGLTIAPRTPEDRIKELNSRQSPYPLKLIHYVFVADAYTVEKQMHQACKLFQVHGEWFEFSDNSYIPQVIQLMESSNILPKQNPVYQNYQQQQQKNNLSFSDVWIDFLDELNQQVEMNKDIEPRNPQSFSERKLQNKPMYTYQTNNLLKYISDNFSLFHILLIISSGIMCLSLFLYLLFPSKEVHNNVRECQWDSQAGYCWDIRRK
ncbi:GIY-YIG nuclease family protein [Nostoc sp. FACHB-110]|uniref:GIY-YIG nuclease family protein n=1 Tax=Nostoc sp. FACHB-110 TaxID=2692834 RepID=UPI0016870914|nr:GIY-YIG nuclease family protein [Nostoc sp. FACHB-110]MBD2441374.1 GIY-YIG nuclease family protein [Nostoc sp. FACHB-110]